MILKSITIQGFKSFEKKTVIDLSKNITGVVGPNGSGKSNIGEAVRFVLGEQSMKSIRSRSLSDLIFRGVGDGRMPNRGFVSIELDNSDFKPKVEDENLSKLLMLDTITLSREVYSDGGSSYKINGAEVRLKDVQMILSFAGIGASNHTIISQGEADKILSSSSADRKEMLEDALGLKLHQIRLKESEKKLRKVEDNINIANVIKRELSPELSHLKVQMDKISKVEEERYKLQVAYINYFRFEEDEILSLQHKIKSSENLDYKISEAENELQNINNRISDNLSNKAIDHRVELRSNTEAQIYGIQNEISILKYELRMMNDKLASGEEDICISRVSYDHVVSRFREMQNENTVSVSAEELVARINELHNTLSDISKEVLGWSGESVNLNHVKSRIAQIDSELLQKEQDIIRAKEELENLKSESSNTPSQVHILNDLYIEKENVQNELRNSRQAKSSQFDNMRNLQERERQFIHNLEEGTKLAGHQILNYKKHNLAENYNHRECERLIERLRIRIEEIGIIDPTMIKNSFEEINGRYTHLENEIQDLEKSRDSVCSLIKDLESSISVDFDKGLEKINFAFDNYFGQVFSGGRAKLFVTKSINDDGDGEVSGVDMSISMPNKKVSDLNMLSGGERTLTSIALLFSFTSILPPPFMVLDETDAALDESNARKYGKLLRKLGEKSRLLVITHNRETMNECDILFGVTMTSEGDSRILSIKFD